MKTDVVKKMYVYKVKTKNTEYKIPDITKASLNASINEFKGEISSINLATNVK